MDFGERGNRNTDLEKEQLLSPFGEAQEKQRKLRIEKGIPEGRCLECGGEIEKGRRDLGLNWCLSCASKQPSDRYQAKRAAVS